MNKIPFLKELKTSVMVVLALVIVLCVVYPLVVWGIGVVFFPEQANGSLIKKDGRVIGSRLVGQSFTDAAYFFSRPSGAGLGYDGLASGGSNLGPLAETLKKQVAQRVNDYRKDNELTAGMMVPVDAVTASGSGLDPHISLENAQQQAKRIAKARGTSLETINTLITKHVEYRQWGIFGENRVNVLLLNLELDTWFKQKNNGHDNE